MPPIKLSLVEGHLTQSAALAAAADSLHELTLPNKKIMLWYHLFQQTKDIEKIVAQHLNIPASHVRLSEAREWYHGSFNAVLPIMVTENYSHLPSKLIFRIPLPYKLGEQLSPGNVGEKLRSEAATYIWLRQNCPDIPIPRLLAFGLPGTISFTSVATSSIWGRLAWFFRAMLMQDRSLAPYHIHSRGALHDFGYLLLEHVDGEMLSESYSEHRHDARRRANLFSGLSRMMISLSRKPLPVIASWTLNDSGLLKLTNRPLWIEFAQMEALGISTQIPRNKTYSCVEQYVLDILACHDNIVCKQRNSISDIAEGSIYLAALTIMRAVLPKFLDRGSHDGPFYLTMTDVHESNIFVDEHWNITSFIDLEWAHTLPLQAIGLPYWLNECSLDSLEGKPLEEYTALCHEFVDVLAREEAIAGPSDHSLSSAIRTNCNTGRLWYYFALSCSQALYQIVDQHIRPLFIINADFTDRDERMFSRLWDQHVPSFVYKKVRDYARYQKKILAVFAAAAEKEEAKKKGQTVREQTHAEVASERIDEEENDM